MQYCRASKERKYDVSARQKRRRAERDAELLLDDIIDESKSSENMDNNLHGDDHAKAINITSGQIQNEFTLNISAAEDVDESGGALLLDVASASDSGMASGIDEDIPSESSDTEPVCDTDSDQNTLKDVIHEWRLRNNISQNAVSDLLKSLGPFIPNLPLDARSLEKVRNEIDLKQLPNGEYYHFGLEKNDMS